MATESHEPAQKLLKDPKVKFYGHLERKLNSLPIKKWIQCFIIVLEGTIYIYSNYYSKKPDLVGILATFHKIEIVKNRTRAPFWIFILKPIIESIEPLNFATSSEHERQLYIKKFTESITISNKLHFNSKQSRVSINNGSNEFNYSNGSLSEKSEENYDIPNDNILPPIPINESEKLEKALFYGNREEAFEELSLNGIVGSYLIRKNNENDILTVNCDGKIIKFILNRDPVLKTVSIQGQRHCFKDLESLLYYYTEYCIPNRNCKLTIPYKLIRKTKQK